MRADRLGAYGYERDISPNIDALAADSLLIERFYSPLPLTAPAHAALFTGRDPWQTGVRYNGIPLSDDEET
ncbi:MAG: sulfatase-like hydrolase/transferase, partial [Deltaproteobacteria bacterium]|nr:sulfatase-like hydrolase/transferase [Deltaproteobacteria bacterium]